MRIFEMRPEITPWRAGQHRKVGRWSFRDEDGGEHFGRVRYVWHYSTLMLFYCQDPDQGVHDDPNDKWVAVPTSVGHGGVSDQNGMNYLLSNRTVWHKGAHGALLDYGYRYYRNGVARLERTDGTVVQ